MSTTNSTFADRRKARLEQPERQIRPRFGLLSTNDPEAPEGYVQDDDGRMVPIGVPAAGMG